MVHCSNHLNIIFFVYKSYEPFFMGFFLYFFDIYFVQEILTCTFIWYFHYIILSDIISHCSSDMRFSLFHNFHFFHFPTMRWPTSPLASDGPVPHRLHDRDTHLLYDLYPLCYSLCVWGGGGESNRVCLCGVGWVHGPSLGLWEWASLHCGGAVGEKGGHQPQE